MVPEEVARHSGQHKSSHCATPLFATSQLRTSDLFPIERWKPRSGRTHAYRKWKTGVGRLLAAFGLEFHQLQEQCPTALPAKREGVTTRGDSEELQHEAALRQAEWQAVNTALFWHVEPSLILEGTAETARDERMINDKMIKGKLADGRALINWALSCASADSLEEQTKLQLAVGAARLRLSVEIVRSRGFTTIM